MAALLKQRLLVRALFMSRKVDGHIFEALEQPCTQCGIDESQYNDWPSLCMGPPSQLFKSDHERDQTRSAAQR